jgi:hypothetical protein
MDANRNKDGKKTRCLVNVTFGVWGYYLQKRVIKNIFFLSRTWMQIVIKMERKQGVL